MSLTPYHRVAFPDPIAVKPLDSHRTTSPNATIPIWRELFNPPVVLLILSSSLLLVRIFYLAHYPYPRMSAESVAYGATEAPFHVRLLAPMMARKALEWSGIGGFIHWNFIVQFFFAATAIVAIYHWLRLLCTPTESLIGLLLAPLIILWSVDMPAADGYPQVFFYALGFIFLFQKRPFAFFVVYLVAMTNRETIAALLLPFIFCFHSSLSRSKLMSYCSLMLAWLWIWKCHLGPFLSPAQLVNKVALFQLDYNLRALQEWSHTLNPFAKNPFCLLGYTWILVPYVWPQLNPVAKLLCLSWIPYYVLMIFVARLTESRVFMEWTPLAVLVCVIAFRRVAGSVVRQVQSV